MTSWNPSGPDPDIAKAVLNAYQLRPEQVGLPFLVKRAHYERHKGWKGILDCLLHRWPLLIIDELELL